MSDPTYDGPCLTYTRDEMIAHLKDNNWTTEEIEQWERHKDCLNEVAGFLD